ncbi:MFS transporter [Corynebacterium uterequi]|uniref:Arabinose efflux permease family protein n=1 Tax=Corynebacterium uterequi TaxID=1072256 RepID=A0A0G3HFG2_9CORY|nr:MFS transporter [Corynebacterium uterequi]AKK12091.1 arabinose efflux permease family protein [Corynebacterium uterequi]
MTANPSAADKAPAIPESAQAGLVTVVVFLAYLGQMLLNPIIAPLSREMGLEEWHIGATISLAAILVTVFSAYWGRTSQRLGVKRVLVTGMALATTALATFGIIANLGMTGALAGVGLVLGVMLTRGVLYGSGISAVAPTAQAHLVTHTASETGRVKALGMIGAAQGMASIIGGIVGGVLAAVGGLLMPLVVMPIVMLVSIVVLVVKFRPQAGTQLIEKPKRISFTDPRILPWLVGGLLMFVVFSSLATIFGFTIQDRFGLDGEATAGVSAIYLTVMGVTMIVGQAVVAPKTGWSAARLFRVGMLLLLVSIGFLWPSSSHVLFAIGCVLLGLGMGLAIPGYNTGPTLRMAEDEQGSVAGVINANNGLAYAVAPVLSTLLYGWNPVVPFVVSATVVALICAYTFVHPTLRG